MASLISSSKHKAGRGHDLMLLYYFMREEGAEWLLSLVCSPCFPKCLIC